MGMNQLYFLRHGETNHNKERRLQGRLDIPLNDTGIQQANASLELLKPLGIKRIIHSPLIRCVETAKIVAAALPSDVILKSDSRLIERDFGSFQNRLAPDLCKELGIEKLMLFENEHFPPDAETMEQVGTRINACIDDLLGQDIPTLIVAHAGIFWQLAIEYDCVPEMIPNSQPYQIIPNAKGSWDFVPVGGVFKPADRMAG